MQSGLMEERPQGEGNIDPESSTTTEGKGQERRVCNIIGNEPLLNCVIL